MIKVTAPNDDRSARAYTATTALPYPHLERATAGLRAELRHQLLEAGVGDPPDWKSLVVEGPEEFTDGRGRKWYGYWATVGVSF